MINVVIEIGFSGNHQVFKKYIFKRYTTHTQLSKRNPQTKRGFHLQFADSTYNLWIPLSVANPQQLNLTLQMSYYMLDDFRKLFSISQVR